MKKGFVLLLLFCLFGGVGCKKEEATLSILLPDGIPAIALGGLFEDSNLDVKIVSGPDLITSELVQENYDCIVAPITAGAKLYLNEATSYRLAAILTTGNTYIVSRSQDTLTSLASLEGKTIAAYGENNTPDIFLKTALAASEINASIVYENSVNDVVSARFIGANPTPYILCAEPVLSTLEIKMGLAINILDLQAELAHQFEFFPQAGIFIRELTPTIQSFLNDVGENVLKLNTTPSSYVDKLLALDPVTYPTFSKLGSNILISAIPRSNIEYIRSTIIQENLNSYFNLLNAYQVQLLGGKIPDEDFVI